MNLTSRWTEKNRDCVNGIIGTLNLLLVNNFSELLSLKNELVKRDVEARDRDRDPQFSARDA